MVLTETGLAKVFQRIKSFVIAQLNSKASAVHTHTSSDITDLPNGYVPRSGGAVLNGRTYSRTVDNDYLAINGSSTAENGAFLRLHGKNYHDTPYAGSVLIRAKNGSNEHDLFLKPDGTATWGGKKIDTIEEQGDGYIRYSNGLQICWCTYPATTETTSTITFPKAFIYDTTHHLLGVSVSGQSQTLFALGWNNVTVVISNTNTGSFTYTAIGRWKI